MRDWTLLTDTCVGALGSAEIFELTGIKGDVGALVVGVLIAHHPKSSELSKTMLSFKNLFLVGFFLSVGMAGNLTITAAVIAIALVPFVFVKSILFFFLLNDKCFCQKFIHVFGRCKFGKPKKKKLHD